jgi:hypothetical protein
MKKEMVLSFTLYIDLDILLAPTYDSMTHIAENKAGGVGKEGNHPQRGILGRLYP